MSDPTARGRTAGPASPSRVWLRCPPSRRAGPLSARPSRERARRTVGVVMPLDVDLDVALRWGVCTEDDGAGDDWAGDDCGSGAVARNAAA